MESDHVVVPVSTEFSQNYFDFSHTDGDSLRDYLKNVSGKDIFKLFTDCS